MIRLSTILWLCMVAAAGFGMFQVKYEVMQLEDELGRVNRAIIADRESIHVLDAEWSFLTQPARLDQLARRYLTLGPIGNAQLGQIGSIPMRRGPVTRSPAEGTAAAPDDAPEASRTPGDVPSPFPGFPPPVKPAPPSVLPPTAVPPTAVPANIPAAPRGPSPVAARGAQLATAKLRIE